MKLGDTLIMCMLIFFYTLTAGIIILTNFIPQIPHSMVTEVDGEDVLSTWTVDDQDTIQHKVGSFLVCPGSVILSPLAIFVNRINGWWKKR